MRSQDHGPIGNAHWKCLRAALLAGLACAGAGTAAATAPPSALVTLAIPAQSLDAALSEFAQQSGLQILFQADAGEQTTAPAVSGKLTAVEALQKLLSNSDLEFEFVDERTVAVRKPGTQKGAANSAGVTSTWAGTERPMMLARVDSTTAAATVSSPTAPSEAPLEEILVTAQRRQESLRDVPISISVYSGSQIEKNRIETLQDYLELTPNVSFKNSGTPISSDVAIRGVSNIGGASNVFGVYVDEFNVAPGAANTTFDQRLVDLERLEVLRGPQGTFFGRNVSGGAINITTRKPQPHFEALALAEVSNYDGYVLRGSVNVPVVDDKLLMRVTGYGESFGGFLKNDGVSNATNDRQSHGGRLALRWLPTERVTADFSLSLASLDQGFPNFVPSGTLDDLFVLFGFPPYPLQAGFYPDNVRHIETDLSRRTRADTLITTGRLEFEADGFSVTSITGFIDSDTEEAGEGDGTALSFWYDDQFNNFESWSTELRAQSNGDGPWQWMVGAIYARDDIEFFGVRNLGPAWFSDILGLPADFPRPASVTPTNDLGTQKITSYGAFGELSWTGLEGRLKLSLSARYQRDEIAETVYSPRNSAFPPFEVTVDDYLGRASFDNLMPRLAATYRFDDHHTGYLVASKGVKPGGYNLGADEVPGSPTTFDEEKLWNYEAGIKGSALSERLRYSLAVFHMDWDQIQVGQFFIDQVTLSGINLTINGTSARSSGVELELAAAPTERLELAAGLGYNDAKFDDFPNAIVSLIGETADVSGNRLPLANEWTANFAAEYRYPLGASTAFARAEYIYRGDAYEDLDNRPTEGDHIPSYDVVNLRFGVETERYSVIGFVDNVTNDDYVSGWVEGALSGYMAVVNPRMWGARLIVHFR